ncbi:MAG: 4Fe-4S binding protein, partial [Candidatus Rokuibacteriota bacterium]
MSQREAAFVASLEARVAQILDTCSRCGRCVEVCPTAGPAGVDVRDPGAVVAEVLDILRGDGAPGSRGARWAETCTGSGRCLTACDDGVNPRFMLAMTRVTLNERKAESERQATGEKAFRTMSEGVRVLSRLQLPLAFVSGVTRSAHAEAPKPADVVMYLGCNVLKTPHIALLCLD